MRFILLILVIAILFGLYSRTSAFQSGSSLRTTSEGPAEQAGKVVDRAFHKAGEAIEEVGETIQEKTDVPTSTPSR